MSNSRSYYYLGLFKELYDSVGIKLAVPVDNNAGLFSIISNTIRRAPYIALVSLRYGKYTLSDLEIIPNILRALKKTTSLDILNWLLDNGVNLIAVPKTDREMLRILGKFEVHFLIVEPGLSLREVLEIIKKQ